MQTNENHETANSEESRLERLFKCEFLGDGDPEFRAFVEIMSDKHWAKYDLSAVRLVWEAYKLLNEYNCIPFDRETLELLAKDACSAEDWYDLCDTIDETPNIDLFRLIIKSD